MMLETEVFKFEPDITGISCSGRFTLGNRLQEMEGLVNSLLDEGVRKLVLDLTHVEFVDSAGLGELPGADKSLDRFGIIAEKARALVSALDVIVWAIDPRRNTLQSFADYLGSYAEELLAASRIVGRFSIPIECGAVALPGPARHNLFLAVKEALNNVVKHARASEVRLGLEVFARAFKLTIEDNGCGLNGGDASKAVHQGRVSTGHGLPNLQKRLETAGGRCVLDSHPGQGTRIEFTVPLDGVSPELAIGGNGQERLNAKG